MGGNTKTFIAVYDIKKIKGLARFKFAILAVAVLIGLVIPLKIICVPPEALYVPTPIDVLSGSPNPDELKRAVEWIAEKYVLTGFVETANCESSFRYNSRGDYNTTTGVYEAYGVFQYHKTTFYAFCEGNYYSAKDQIVCAAKMFKAGQQAHWTCFLKGAY